jgi:hypothetical protein
MHKNLRCLAEALLAELTQEWLLTCMNIRMLFQVLLRCEGFTTGLAVKELDVKMCDFDVTLEIVFCRV